MSKYPKIRSLVDPYIKEVLSENGRHGQNEIMAVQRFLNDIERDDIYIDEEIALKRYQAAKLFRHTADKWYRVPFGLQPFQIFMIINSFGWHYTETKKRRFQKVFLDIARKNGKTEFASMLMDLHLYFEHVPGSEGYFAATTRDQASIGFETAKTMMKFLRQDSARARSKLRILTRTVTIPSIQSKMEAISADSKKLDGRKPSYVIIDEYHAHPTSNVLKVMETGMINRPNPMMYITTTAGFNRTYPCYHFRSMCNNLLKGVIEDDTLFPMMFTMDEGDDWKNPENWYKANPNLGVTIPEERLGQKLVSSENEGITAINELKTKNFNIYTSVAETWISDAQWMENNKKPSGDKKQAYWGGLDISTVRDLTAYVLLGEDGSIIPYFWCPQKKIEDRDNKDGVDYRLWHEKGLIKMIRGNAIDQRIIKEDVIRINREYNVKNTMYDPWRLPQMAQELYEKRVPIMKMEQTYKNFTPAIAEMEKNILDSKYRHGGHPILRWMIENTVLKVNPNNNVMFDKSKIKGEKGKIDGIVALGMAEFGRMNEIDKRYKGKGIIKL